MDSLESDIIDTLLAGHKEWRSDLGYPESHSDMQAAVRGLLRMYDVKRRALPMVLEYACYDCHSTGRIKYRPDPENEPNSWKEQACHCRKD